MIDYIGKMLGNSPEDVKGESATPATHHLFDIVEDATRLSQSDADLFNNFVAQLIYFSKGKCTDIQIAVSLLCTRVRRPDNDDYDNVARVMKYI